MRLSCNGCRVLRKGCSDACTIRPCLHWITSPDAQANATVFLAKFYGRAGLLNLLAAAPTDALRPAVFRSLLYEACGRILNPVYGAVGLLCSGTWHLCQAAVDAVLKGAPIVQVSPDDAAAAAGPPIIPTATVNAAPAPAAAYDIRHVFPNKHHSQAAAAAAAAATVAQSQDDKHTDSRGLLHREKVVVVSKPKSKRTSSSSSPSKKTKTSTAQNNNNNNSKPHLAAASPAAATEHDDMHSDGEEQRHAAVRQATNSRRASSDDCDRHSASASSHVSQAEQDEAEQQQPPSMGLDLTLGLLTSSAPPHVAPPTPAGCRHSAAVDDPAGVIGFRFL